MEKCNLFLLLLPDNRAAGQISGMTEKMFSLYIMCIFF